MVTPQDPTNPSPANPAGPETRGDGRTPEQLRPVKITPGFMPKAEGSALIEMGDTHVICTATVSPGVPRWRRGSGKGWVTAEYAMLPRATDERVRREVASGRPSGRTQEIQRLTGRALRSVTNMAALGENTVTIDCDVLRADGGTRTAAITGGYVALHAALESLRLNGAVDSLPLNSQVAAVSVGIVNGVEMLDLTYPEDSTADVDLNVVMTGEFKYVEVQGTAEQEPFDNIQFNRLLDLGRTGVESLLVAQKTALGV